MLIDEPLVPVLDHCVFSTMLLDTPVFAIRVYTWNLETLKK